MAQHLDFLYEQYGFHAGRQGYFVASSPAASAAVFTRLREGYPTAIGKRVIENKYSTDVESSPPPPRGLLKTSTGSTLNLLLLLRAYV